MQRIALGVEYLGTNYSGWQKQLDPQVPSVQSAVEDALTQIANHPITTVCAGRTDAGVHASAQVVHFDSPANRSERAWVFGANTKLPKDIRVLWAQKVPAEFDARRSAIQRHYKYVIYNSSLRTGLLHNYMTWHYIQLDVAKMHAAAQSWVGTHDFTSFRAAGCQSKSPVRDLQLFTIRRSGNLIIFDILANAFLYHMIRNMVGTLLAIGGGNRPVAYAAEVLLAKDRAKAGATAPAEGLYLAGVKYPDWLLIPEQSSGLWFLNQG